MKTMMLCRAHMGSTAHCWLASRAGQRCAAHRRLASRAGALSMEGMAASGEYAANSLQQQAAFRLLFPYVADALRATTARRAVIADYGAADGLATSQLLHALSDVTSLDVVLQDLPTNDWDAAANIVAPHGALQQDMIDASEPIPAAVGAGLRLFAAPGDFYEQCLPSASVDVAVSGTSWHWLRDTHRLPWAGSLASWTSRTEAVARTAWLTYGAQSWEGLLAARAAELKPGGSLIATLAGTMPDGSDHYTVLFETLDRMLAERERRGVVSAATRRAFVLPAISRTAEEVGAGFAKLKSQLHLRRLEAHSLRCPFYDAASIATREGRLAFAHQYTANVYGWARRMIEGALDDAEERASFRDELTASIAARAEELEYDWPVMVVVAVRR